MGNGSQGEGARQGAHGLIVLHTGDGKGKTTAAIGTVLRAWGQGLRVCVIQFIKAEGGRWGEVLAAEKLGLEWHTAGDGWTWRSSDLSQSIACARSAWELAQCKVVSGSYDLIMLDEFTYPLTFGWLDAAQVAGWLQVRRPSGLHLIITGRYAPAPLIACADLVTDMRKVKHPFDQGIMGQAGIEF